MADSGRKRTAQRHHDALDARQAPDGDGSLLDSWKEEALRGDELERRMAEESSGVWSQARRREKVEEMKEREEELFLMPKFMLSVPEQKIVLFYYLLLFIIIMIMIILTPKMDLKEF